MDLRMNSKTGKSAVEWLQVGGGFVEDLSVAQIPKEATVEEVAWVIREYGPDDQELAA